MVAPAIVLLYPSLLASLTANPNSTTIFAGDDGIPYVIDISDPIFTQAEITQMNKEATKVTFLLYTRKNRKVGQRIFINDVRSIRNSFWNPDHPTRLVTHGWQGNCENPVCTLIRNAYLATGDYNVILIDWRYIAGGYYYPKVARTVPLIAQRVSLLLDFLERDANLNPRNTKIIGHSLGGHIAGLSARFANSEIAEITALDPAKPKFDSKGPGERVDKSDASMVQVIHTCAGVLGLEKPVGTADFYPNGGTSQPGCDIDIIGTCAHARSYEYYAESVLDPKGFRAEDVYMGGAFLDKNAQGDYILKTNDRSPFALG